LRHFIYKPLKDTVVGSSRLSCKLVAAAATIATRIHVENRKSAPYCRGLYNLRRFTVLQPPAFYNIEEPARGIDNFVKMSADPIVSAGIREHSAISGLDVQSRR